MNREFKKDWEQAHIENWQENTRRKYAMIEKNLAFESEMIRREQLRIDQVREHHRQDCGYSKGDEQHGIAWFEKNLQRIGIDTSEHSESTGGGMDVKTTKELFEKMQEQLPTQEQLKLET